MTIKLQEFNNELNEKLKSFDDGNWTNESYNGGEGNIIFYIKNKVKDLESKINIDTNASVDQILRLCALSM